MPSRMIREGLLDSDPLAQAGELAEVLFTRLMLVADDYGRFDGRVTVICRRCWPLGGPNEQDVAARLASLARVGLVTVYQAEGKPFICIPKFNQRLRLKTKSKYPDPPETPTAPVIRQPDAGQVTDTRRPEVEVKRSEEPLPPSVVVETTVPPPSAPVVGGVVDESKAHELAAVCASNRVTGAHFNGQHVQQWLREGVTADLLRDAIAQARATGKPHPEVIPVKYLLPIVERARSGGGKPPDNAWRKDTNRAVAKGRELGVSPRAGEEMYDFVQRIDEALRDRARSQVA